MALQQYTDSFPADSGYQFAFDGFGGDQPDRPSGPTVRRTGADHGDDSLLLRGCEQFRCSGSRLVKESALEATGFVSMSDVADRLCCQAKQGCCNARCSDATTQMQQRHCTKDYPHRLHAAVQQLIKRLPVTCSYIYANWALGHGPG